MRPAPPDFKKAYASGKSVANQYLVLYYLRNDQEESRLGFSISRRVGGATERNRLRRRLKEIFRAEEGELKKPYDVIVICRPRAAGLSYQKLEKALVELLVRSGLGPEEGKK